MSRLKSGVVVVLLFTEARNGGNNGWGKVNSFLGMLSVKYL